MNVQFKVSLQKMISIKVLRALMVDFLYIVQTYTDTCFTIWHKKFWNLCVIK